MYAGAAAIVHDYDLPDTRKNITSERSVALLSTIFRHWKRLRQGEVEDWQDRHPVK